jgi:hypothetical protein
MPESRLVKLDESKPLGKGPRLVVLSPRNVLEKKLYEHLANSMRAWDLFFKPRFEAEMSKAGSKARLPTTSLDTAIPLQNGRRARKWLDTRTGALKFWVVIS